MFSAPNRDCADLKAFWNMNRDAVYTVREPNKMLTLAVCDMNTDNGGWTVFQRSVKNNMRVGLGITGKLTIYREFKCFKSYKSGHSEMRGSMVRSHYNLKALYLSFMRYF